MNLEQNFNSQDTEILIQNISNTIERLKTEYNLFFAGEIRVPPEQDREQLEKRIRNLVSGGSKNPRLALLIQNVSSKFTLYNNMWLKRLNELEGGFVRNRRKPVSFDETIKEKLPKKTTVDVSLNSEDSFEEFYENYKKMSKLQSTKIMDKEKMINSIKTKLITANLIDVKIDMQIEKGKVKLKLKKKKFE
jgi:predicted RND superfamily exporter protein